MRVEARKAARLFVLDEHGRILLFCHRDPLGQMFWATPGGGVERGETFEQAARREAEEELGAAPVSLHDAGERELLFPWGHRMIRQFERYFVASYPSDGLATLENVALGDEGVLEVRWWTIAEIDGGEHDVRPPDLAERMRALEDAR